MNHPFSPNVSDRTICALCKYPHDAHTDWARCEECLAYTKCDIFENRLLCEKKCLDAAKDLMKVALSENKDLIDDVLTRAKAIDQGIRYNGDLFNAQTIANVEIKAAIDKDDSIEPAAKLGKYQMALVERFEHFQSVIFDCDETKHRAVIGQLAIAQDLRALGNQLREDIRNRLKLADASYAPLSAMVKPNVKKVKTSPFEQMVEKVALKNNVSLDEARRILQENMRG